MGFLLYSALTVLGACLGSQVNRAIYRLAWNRRPIGPWSAPHPDAPSRRSLDRLPILGWFGLRREAPIHGSGYWLRPMLIELALATGLAVLYWWEVSEARLMPGALRGPFDPWLLHAQYTAHVILVLLMTVATFIDFDEQTIPDAVTLPGTLAGLVLMAVWPAAAFPTVAVAGPGLLAVAQVHVASPLAWPVWLDGTAGLAIGILCLLGWALAVWPKTITMRRGPFKAVQYLLVSMLRYRFWWLILLIPLLGGAGIALVWAGGAPRWPSLFTALVGMAFGGGLIWLVRVIGSGALGKEAMGFGDVTLMAMIGVYAGWQASLMIFFLAPFVAVFICLAQWLLTRRRDIAFGPYLCAATLIVILKWSPIWEEHAKEVFRLGWLIPQLLFFCLILLAGMLRLWRITERALCRERAAAADRDRAASNDAPPRQSARNEDDRSIR